MKYIFALLIAICGMAHAQTCTTTISTPASNITTAISAASTGDVICLNSGTYGSVTVSSVKAGYVIVRSVTPLGAKVNWTFSGAQFIHVKNTQGSVLMTGCSKNLYIEGVAGTPQTQEGMQVLNDTCPTTVQNITIDGAVFDRIGQFGQEGRLSLTYANTVTITNSQFLGVDTANGNNGPSDGIFMGGSIRNIMIGPGNYFSGIDQNTCNSFGGAHCDMIQTFGGPCSNVRIEGNYFTTSSSFILNESECSGTFKHNVVVNITTAQWHTWNPLDWSHNTLYNTNVNFNQSSTFNNLGTFNNNIFHGGGLSFSGTFGCSNCTSDHNIATGGCGTDEGTNCLTCTPTYVGGTPPPTGSASGWSVWRLTGTCGVANASDGKNRGTLYFKPAAPSNLQ